MTELKGRRLRVHPRYFIVTEAKIALDMAVIRIEEKYDLDIEQVLSILLQIATETNKVPTCKDRAPLMRGLAPYEKELLDIVVELEAKHELTTAESIKNLLEAAQNVNKYAIRIDRHPNDPNKKGDEA